MLKDSIKGVEKSVKAVEKTIKNPPKSAADVERAQEAAKSAEGERNIFQGIYDTLSKGFGAATTKDKKSGGLIAGLLGGVGAGLGGIGKAVANIGKGFGIGLAALGAGIAGFAIALGGASMILGLMGTDGSELTAIITNFFDAFTMENAAKMGVILVIAGALSKLDVSPIRFAGMMTAMGAGIAGFAGGILIGEIVAGYGLKMMAGLDGGSIGKIIGNFFAGFTPVAAAGLGVIVTIAGTLAKFDVSPTNFAKQMVGIAAGIAGFAGGILLGEVAAGFGLKLMGGMDGGSLITVMDNFFGAMTPKIAAGLGVVVTIAGLLTKFAVGPHRIRKTNDRSWCWYSRICWWYYIRRCSSQLYWIRWFRTCWINDQLLWFNDTSNSSRFRGCRYHSWIIVKICSKTIRFRSTNDRNWCWYRRIRWWYYFR